jgi:hypothetical protein
MSTPLLYRQLYTQLSQWIRPKDQRHLRGFAENIAAILQSNSGCLSHWLSYLSHRACNARSLVVQKTQLRLIRDSYWNKRTAMKSSKYADFCPIRNTLAVRKSKASEYGFR